MKQLLIAFVCFAFVGCEEGNVQRENTGYKIYSTQVQIIVIDSCQYLYYPNGNAAWCTHKGNCNNPIHSKH